MTTKANDAAPNVSANFDFTPIERMKAHLLDFDRNAFDTALANKNRPPHPLPKKKANLPAAKQKSVESEHENPLWFVNAPFRHRPIGFADDLKNGEISLTIAPDSIEHAMTGWQAGTYAVRKLIIEDYAPSLDVLQKVSWSVDHAPYLLANLAFDPRMEQYESLLAMPQRATKLEQELFECYTSDQIEIYELFAVCVGTMKSVVADILAAKGSPSVMCQRAPLIEEMEKYGMLAPHVSATVDAQSSPTKAINERKATMSDGKIIARYNENKKKGLRDYCKQTAIEANITPARVRQIVSKGKNAEGSNSYSSLVKTKR